MRGHPTTLTWKDAVYLYTKLNLIKPVLYTIDNQGAQRFCVPDPNYFSLLHDMCYDPDEKQFLLSTKEMCEEQVYLELKVLPELKRLAGEEFET